MDTKQYLQQWAQRYKDDLVNNVMPFWMKYGLDRQNGGVYTCVDRDGTLMDTTKSVWFQGRFGFIAAAAYNNIEQNPEWLAASKSCIDFIIDHCTAPDGRMYFEVTAEGTPLRMRCLLPAKYLPNVQCQGHSLTMILINTASRLRMAIDDPTLTEQIDTSLHAIKHYFMHPEYKALLETVGPNGEFIDTINGRTINPGHCIETAWFVLEESRHRNWDADLKQIALEILDWSWDWGWDEPYGGIINFRDCKGLPSQDYAQDMKFWWPQTETVIAMLYAYLATGDEKYLERHQLINDWTYKHLPDPEFGEWYGYLHRDGTVAQPAKGNLFKGPFHIPRMLINSFMLCNEILKTKF